MKTKVERPFSTIEFTLIVETEQELAVLKAIFGLAKFDLVSRDAAVDRSVSDAIVERLFRMVSNY